MSERVEVRTARAEDALDLARLSEQLGYPISPAEARERLDDLAGEDHQAVAVAELVVGDERLFVGWTQVVRLNLVVDRSTALVSSLVVDQEHRGHGIGRRLMEWAEGWARAKGCTALRARSRTERQGAHAFYAALGWRRTKTQHSYRKDLDR